LFVTVRVTTDTRQAPVTVPETAIQTIEDSPSVFLRTDDGFEARTVVLGSRSAGQVEILQGLDAGAHVATAGSFILKSELGKASAEHAH
jgi:cobalt-zinc-cadmium efflux system membrane fusion protein